MPDLEDGVRQSMFQEALREYISNLVSYRGRGQSALPDEFYEMLSQVKGEFVSKDDQVAGKAVWCMETIGRIQDDFISVFLKIGEYNFKESWDLLSKCESSILALDPHFREIKEEFGIEHIRIHTKQLQELFPVKWGFSPGLLIKEKRCSVCNAKLTLNSGCEHRSGEIYDGEICHIEVTQMELLHISLVDNPAQKGTVIWPDEREAPQFTLLEYLNKALMSPWDAWSCEKEERRIYHPSFKNASRNARCPCGSPNKYKRCCLKKELVPEFPHFQFTFRGGTDWEFPHVEVYTDSK